MTRIVAASLVWGCISFAARDTWLNWQQRQSVYLRYHKIYRVQEEMLHSRFLLGLMTLCLTVGALAADSPEGDAEAGKESFLTYCSACHNHENAEKKIGPGLVGIKDGKLPSEKEATHENILENLNKGATGMPAFEKILNEEEKADIIAFVMSL